MNRLHLLLCKLGIHIWEEVGNPAMAAIRGRKRCKCCGKKKNWVTFRG